MPVYEYICNNCNKVFTKLLKMDDRKAPESQPCPQCGEVQVHQAILSVPSIADPIRLGVTRQDTNFKEVLRGIHEKTAGSKIDTYL